MDGNGESVYGSKAGPWQGLGWGRTTASRRDPKRAYLHVFEWPRDGRLRLPSLARPVSSATFVAGGVALPVEEGRGGILIRGPTRAPDPVDTVVRLQLAEGLVP
jgi:alpha-L-fucosidase